MVRIVNNASSRDESGWLNPSRQVIKGCTKGHHIDSILAQGLTKRSARSCFIGGQGEPYGGKRREVVSRTRGHGISTRGCSRLDLNQRHEDFQSSALTN